ncbi:hypothetical protein F5148DRAFT_523103 [Russula earlei]|uniref:Uncharacterized protein n=1 Tax=Russula earlei TaxID=71964 RepID=A0ACC0UIQ3_9AGAM|nr:hypothetical protein F5148DRAFT_523103 [Russula earlei]
MEDHLRTMLIWPRAESDICVLVIAIDLVRFSCSWTWPTSMRLEIWEGGLGTLDIQSTNFKGNAPMAQIKCAPGMGNPEFEALFGSLRRVGGFAVAQHDVYDGGRHLRLLFAPLGNVLLCAVLPGSDIEELLKCRSSRQQSHAAAKNQYGQSSQEITLAVKESISPLYQRCWQPQAYGDATQQPQPPWTRQLAPLGLRAATVDP